MRRLIYAILTLLFIVPLFPPAGWVPLMEVSVMWAAEKVRYVDTGSSGGDGTTNATSGATACSYESPDINLGYGCIEWLDRQFFSEYSVNHTDILGDTWSHSITAVLQACPIDWSDGTVDGSAIIVKNVEQWVLFGDPSLKIGGYR